jgi:prepilin-type N-terminal cleavage/methylation domain-containing protein
MRNRTELQIADCGLRTSPGPIRNPQSEIRNPNGFTLLELVMVMTIIVILAAVGSYLISAYPVEGPPRRI